MFWGKYSRVRKTAIISPVCDPFIPILLLQAEHSVYITWLYIKKIPQRPVAPEKYTPDTTAFWRNATFQIIHIGHYIRIQKLFLQERNRLRIIDKNRSVTTCSATGTRDMVGVFDQKKYPPSLSGSHNTNDGIFGRWVLFLCWTNSSPTSLTA